VQEQRGSQAAGLDTLGATMPLVQGGELELLAVGTQQRLPEMAQVPTIAELGYPGFEALAWIGLAGTAAMPLALREKLHAQAPKYEARSRTTTSSPSWRPCTPTRAASRCKTSRPCSRPSTRRAGRW
jgi:tripartite-type tricarboxylate transporter receptor subunit TctC